VRNGALSLFRKSLSYPEELLQALDKVPWLSFFGHNQGHVIAKDAVFSMFLVQSKLTRKIFCARLAE
jgi:hypothetical protein